MPGTAHAGTLGRWFEELCRIKVNAFRSVVVGAGTRLRSGQLATVGGVYAFWWTGQLKLLRASSCNRHIELHGPGGKPVRLEIDDEWLGVAAGLPVPLYVGKNAGNLSKRVGQHLCLNTERLLDHGKGARKQSPPTTTCQLRAGVDHLFPSEKDTRSLLLDNIGFSFVPLDGNDYAASRFYLEDLAIGLMRPPFNIDVER